MLRFFGVRYGFDLNLRRKVLRVFKLEFDQYGGDSWVYAGFETPYPIPPEFLGAADTSKPWHPWQLAWKDLEAQNPRGCDMLRTLVIMQ